jgi:hypothetical protein
MLTLKFRRLIRDQYKREFILLISKNYKKVLEIEEEQEIYPIYKIIKELDKKKLKYNCLNNLNELRSHLVHVYPDFIICLDE